MAKEIRSTHGDEAHSIVGEVVRDLKLGGSSDHQGAQAQQVATSIVGSLTSAH
jgi:hypothetical protein